jgi:hypothetical protein
VYKPLGRVHGFNQERPLNNLWLSMERFDIIANTMDFVDLKRYFVPVREDQETDLNVGGVWGPQVSGWLSWNDLKLRRRVILLAEAYSGKTEEFRHQCEVLRAEDKPAFFLRIEDLDRGTEQALDGQSIDRFRTWLTTFGEAWFFLDSVDEARLNRKNFDGFAPVRQRNRRG